MPHDSLSPHGENLRKAITWLSHQIDIQRQTIEQASVKFDLTPLEEDFLLRNFIQEKSKKDVREIKSD